MNPSEAISKARSKKSGTIRTSKWQGNTKITGVQEREWALTEIEYYTISEKREDFEFPLSKDVPQNNPPDPFETDEATIYEEVSTENCSICGGEGVSPCETCGGNGEMDCPHPNCRDGKEVVDCECHSGKALDDCPECRGRGDVFRNGYEKTCTECGGSGEVYKTHTRCNGTGDRIVDSCDRCTNEPPINKPGLVECTDCSSPEHENTCNNCEGEGTTYHGIRIERSYNVEMEKTIEDDIPEEVFEQHADCVTVDEYDSDSVPPNEVISEEVQSAEDFRVTKKRLEGYDINYTFDGKEFNSTVIGDSIYGEIPAFSQEDSNFATLYSYLAFGIWLTGLYFIIESGLSTNLLWVVGYIIASILLLFVSGYIFRNYETERVVIDGTHNLGFS